MTSIQTLELEILVRQLASAIKDYPKTDRRTIMQTARRLDTQLVYGQKQRWKDNLIASLGYDTRGYKVKGSLQRIPQNIMYLTDIGVEDIAKVVTRHPLVLAYSIKNTMKPIVKYLRSIGVKRKHIRKIVTRFPRVFGYSIENTMKPIVKYLRLIGVKDIGKVVTTQPQIFGHSIENNLKPTYEFLQEHFDVTPEDITTSPFLLSSSLEKRIKPRYKFLKHKRSEKKYKANTILVWSDKQFCSKLGCTQKEYRGYLKKTARPSKKANMAA